MNDKPKQDGSFLAKDDPFKELSRLFNEDQKTQPSSHPNSQLGPFDKNSSPLDDILAKPLNTPLDNKAQTAPFFQQTSSPQSAFDNKESLNDLFHQNTLKDKKGDTQTFSSPGETTSQKINQNDPYLDIKDLDPFFDQSQNIDTELEENLEEILGFNQKSNPSALPPIEKNIFQNLTPEIPPEINQPKKANPYNTQLVYDENGILKELPKKEDIKQTPDFNTIFKEANKPNPFASRGEKSEKTKSNLFDTHRLNKGLGTASETSIQAPHKSFFDSSSREANKEADFPTEQKNLFSSSRSETSPSRTKTMPLAQEGNEGFFTEATNKGGFSQNISNNKPQQEQNQADLEPIANALQAKLQNSEREIPTARGAPLIDTYQFEDELIKNTDFFTPPVKKSGASFLESSNEKETSLNSTQNHRYLNQSQQENIPISRERSVQENNLEQPLSEMDNFAPRSKDKQTSNWSPYAKDKEPNFEHENSYAPYPLGDKTDGPLNYSALNDWNIQKNINETDNVDPSLFGNKEKFNDEKTSKQKIIFATLGAFLAAIAAIYFYTNSDNTDDLPAIIKTDNFPYKIAAENQEKDLSNLPGIATYDHLSGAETDIPEQKDLIEENDNQNYFSLDQKQTKLASTPKETPPLNQIDAPIDINSQDNDHSAFEANLPKERAIQEGPQEPAFTKNLTDSKIPPLLKNGPPRKKSSQNDVTTLKENQIDTKKQPVEPKQINKPIANNSKKTMPLKTNFSGYFVQLAAQPTKDLADKTLTQLTRRYGSLIAKTSVVIQKADIKNRGIFYRIRLQLQTKNQAIQLCDKLKKAGASCFVTK